MTDFYINVFQKGDYILVNEYKNGVRKYNKYKFKSSLYFRNNTKNSNNRIVYLPFTLTDLADYLAVNRSAMSRELKNLKDEGFIEIKNKKIKLLFDADIN